MSPSLNGALVFAMTLPPGEEARAAARRSDQTLAWGFGAHPGLPDASSRVNETVLREAVRAHVVMGESESTAEVQTARSTRPSRRSLMPATDSPVLSLHRTRRTRQLLDVLRQHPHPGAVLH